MRVWHGVAIRYALLQQVMIHDQRAPFRVVLSGCARYFLSGDGLVQGAIGRLEPDDGSNHRAARKGLPPA